MPKLDAKFYGEIRKAKNDSIVPDDEYVVFLAHDNVFAEFLPFYLQKCIEAGCDAEDIRQTEGLLNRVNAWRAANPDKCKLPDGEGEKFLDVS